MPHRYELILYPVLLRNEPEQKVCVLDIITRKELKNGTLRYWPNLLLFFAIMKEKGLKLTKEPSNKWKPTGLHLCYWCLVSVRRDCFLWLTRARNSKPQGTSLLIRGSNEIGGDPVITGCCLTQKLLQDGKSQRAHEGGKMYVGKRPLAM